ncbi:hypothetical protein QKJ47_gp6 [Aruac virus]|uniref:Uncharacterized protein n=1 Tax=Aruac virus TaxID=1272961 RepID=A0A0D3R146_9RHAB|nr:hypothetical protein QKJ47_gp6 [Aruac virus]AJR28316.1 hypothetical protein [Aruac virus]
MPNYFSPPVQQPHTINLPFSLEVHIIACGDNMMTLSLEPHQNEINLSSYEKN